MFVISAGCWSHLVLGLILIVLSTGRSHGAKFWTEVDKFMTTPTVSELEVLKKVTSIFFNRKAID